MYSQSAFWTSLLFRQCQSVSALQYRMDEKLTRHLKGNTDTCCHQSIPWFDPIALLSGSTNICQRSCRERELLGILDVYPFSFQILELIQRCELYQTEKTSQIPNSNKDMLPFKSWHTTYWQSLKSKRNTVRQRPSFHPYVKWKPWTGKLALRWSQFFSE